MAPPAGTSSMLRSRRRDATLKPNRTLDRSASRGMLYENEELRLRTININAEVEKGQSYIKKLRRENEQLKREIWNLREEYERLENYVKSREQSENEEEDEGDEYEDGELPITEEPTTADAAIAESLALETVIEEDCVDEDLSKNVKPFPDSVVTIVDGAKSCDKTDNCSDNNNNNNNSNYYSSDNNNDVVVDATNRQRCDVVASECRTIPGDEVRISVTAAGVLAAEVGRCGDDRYDSGCPPQHHIRQKDQITVDRAGDLDPSVQGQLDAAVLQPHTACFETGNNCQLHDLTVDEVIDAVLDVELRDKLRTVCLTDDRCYMTFANAECLERALHAEAAFRVRDVPVLLMDTGAGAVILSLTGVPDSVADKEVLRCLKKYGTIIGGVERKTARGGTTGGERYVRVRLTLGAPRYLWFGSDKVIVRQLTEHETGTMNSIARRKSFRSQIKLNLKMAADPSHAEPKENGGGSGGNGGGAAAAAVATAGALSAGVGSTATATAISVQNGFRFPTDAKTTAGSCGAQAAAASEPKTTSATGAANNNNKSTTGSPKKSKQPANECGATPPTAASSGQAESSPLRARRRTSLMGFRRETIKHRGGSVTRVEAEDADSDTSTICRRKLSITGREGTEKVPWCGCWGNGCL